MSKQPSTATIPDLYPEVTDYQLDGKLSTVLRQQGKNPTAMQQELNSVLASGDFSKKAQLLESYAALTDRVNGNSAASNFLTSRRRLLESEQRSSMGSVSGTQAFAGLTGNGLVDLAESLPKLAIAAYEGIRGDKKEWERANKSVENFFAPLRTYVSQDYQQGIASYDSDTGLDINLNAKSMIGTAGSLFSYILPGLLTAGGGTVASIGARSALRGAATAAEAAVAAKRLGTIGKAVKGLTGASSFLQMFPSYQKEALEAGLSISDATLFAIPVAAINGFIETANVGPLTKALGLTDDVAKDAIRAVTMQEVRGALQGLVGKPLTKDTFLDVAEGAAKNAIGRISRAKEMSMVGRMAGSLGRRVGRGFVEQGIPEGGEEFMQAIVENAARQIYNNFGAATGATEGNGKFKDPTLGNYVFDSVYGTMLGSLVGTGMGTIVQQRKLDPTVFGYINADVRLQLAKGAQLADIVPNLKVTRALDAALQEGKLDQAGYDELTSTIGRMAETAAEFADVDGFTDSDRYLMFKMSESRNNSRNDAVGIEALKAEFAQLDGQLQSGSLSMGDQLKGEIRRNELIKQLGGQITDANNQPTGQFEAEKFIADRASEFETIARQTLAQYATESDRSAIKGFFNNNYTAWQKKFGQRSTYEDPFNPVDIVVDPLTNETLAIDPAQKFFRVITPTGGTVSQPMQVNDQGRFVPSVREALSYDYSKPVDDIARHMALSQTLSNPQDPMTQTVQRYEDADNSPAANWIRDGEDLVNTVIGLQSNAAKKGTNAKQVKDLVTAFLGDSTFLASDPKYGGDYQQLATQLQAFVGTATQPSQPTSGSTTQQTPPASQVHSAQLPKDLAGARPRYGYQGTNFALQFASDVDRALYITSQNVPSKRDAEYRRFLTQLGYTNTEIAREGTNVRNTLKAKAQDALLNGAKNGDVLKLKTPVAVDPATTRQAQQSPSQTSTPAPTTTPTAASTPTPSPQPSNAEPNQAAPTGSNRSATPTFFARSVDRPNGFDENALSPNDSNKPLYAITPISATEATFTIAENADGQARGLDDPYSYLKDGADYSIADAQDATGIITTQPGKLVKNGDSWVITQKAQIQFINGQSPQVSSLSNLAQPAQAAPASQPEYAVELQRAESIETANQAEAELESALDSLEQSDGIPNVGTVEQLIDIVNRVIAATREATGATGEDVSEQSVDESDTPVSAPAPVTLPEGPLTLADALTALTSARGQQAGEEFESGLMTLLRFPKFLQESMLFYGTPPESKTPTGKISQKRGPKNKDSRIKLPLDFFRSAAEILSGQRKEQTSPAADEVLRKLLTVYLDGGVEIDDRTSGQRAFVSWDQLAATAAMNEQVYADGLENIEPMALLAADELVDQLSESDIDAILSIVDELEVTNGQNWLLALSERLNNTFPPLSDQIQASIEQIVADYRLANEQVIFDNADESNPTFGRIANQYDTAQRGIRTAVGIRQTEGSPVSSGSSEQQASGLPTPESQSDSSPEAFESAVEAYESGQLSPEEAQAVLSQIEEAISTEASQDPVTAHVVAPIDIELADLSIKEETIKDSLMDEDSPALAEDSEIQLENVRAQKKAALQRKVEAAEKAVSQKPDRLAEKLDELDEAEVALAKRLNAKFKSMNGSLSANPFLDPELIGLVGEYFGLKVQKGVYQFAKIARDFVRATGESITPENLKLLRGTYAFYRNIADEDVAARMDDDATSSSVSVSDINEVLSVKAQTGAQILANAPTFTETDVAPESTVADVLDHETQTQRTTPVLQLDAIDINQQAVDIGQQVTALETQAAAATTNRERSRLVAQIDSLLNELDQIIEDEFDKSGETERDYNEWGSKAPARKAKAATARLAKSLAAKLGLQPSLDKKGKAIWATENIAPVGGNTRFYLWSNGELGKRKGIYVSLQFNRDYLQGGSSDTLLSERIRTGVVEESDQYSRRINDRRFEPSTTFSELVTTLQRDLSPYESYPEAQPGPGPVQKSRRVSGGRNASQIDLFGAVQPELSEGTGTVESTGEQSVSNGDAGLGSLPINETAEPGSAGQPVAGDNLGDNAGTDAGRGTTESNGERGAEPTRTETGIVDEAVYSRITSVVRSLRDVNRDSDAEQLLALRHEYITSERISAQDSNNVFKTRRQAKDAKNLLTKLISAEEAVNQVSNLSQAGVEPTTAVKQNQNNFIIYPETALAPKGDVAKIKANIAAIKLVKEIIAAERKATPSEQKVLVQYTGWGGLSEVLNEQKYADYKKQNSPTWPQWKTKDSSIENWGSKFGAYHEQLVEILDEAEFKAAQASTLNAHYTDGRIVSSIWDAVRRMGFGGGRVLEPAGGIGHFFGIMPTDLSENSQLMGVEKDIISGQIMSLLYPDADIRISGFEDVHYPNGSMDLVISNVPFGSIKVYDAENRDLSKFPIHNYFIARSARQLRPGGIAAIVTSMFTMDQTGTEFRKWLNTEGGMDLVGAIRLPSSAFAENAGTSVTTDILFFQKRAGLVSAFPENTYIGTVNQRSEVNDETGERRSIDLNEYYVKNPENLLGEMRFADEVGSGGLYRGSQATLYNASPGKVPIQLAERIQTLAENIMQPRDESVVPDGQKKQQRGKVRVKDGKVIIESRNGLVSEVLAVTDSVKIKSKSYTKAQVMSDYAAIKDAYFKLIESEQNDVEENTIQSNRTALNKAYYLFTTKYGELTRNRNVAFIEDIDKEFSTVQALENVKKQRNAKGKISYVIEKANIFNERVFRPVQIPKTAESLDDAIRINKSFFGEIRLGNVASMLGLEPDEVINQAVNEGLGFVDPASGKLEMRDDYLSGNIRKKLQLAERAAETDRRFVPNVKALTSVVPDDIPISLISFRLGSTWVPDEVIQQFVQKELDMDADVTYHDGIKEYVVKLNGNSSAKNRSMGTGERTALELLESALNQRSINITYTEKDPITGSKTTVKDKEATSAAIAAREQLNQLFVDYAKDNHRAVLEQHFNELYNNNVHKEFRMPSFTHYPGASTAITLRDHQRRATQRIIEGDTLLAHGVGTGKTFTMITAAMELKRLKIASKPMLVVQNSTVEQFRSSFQLLYPGSNAYVATSSDMESANRRRFLQRIASNNFDAVVIPQSFLKLIPNDPIREEEFTNVEIQAVETAIYLADEDGQGKKNLVKKMQELVNKLENRRKKQADYKKDEILTFDQLGVDALFLDESHEFKRLGFYTHMSNIKGIDTAGSEQAFSAMMKTRSVQAKNGRVVMATGTPISNTMAEAWTIMRYISDDLLSDARIDTFDQFAAAFGSVEDNFELTTTGNFKNVSRFAKFTNIAQLSHLFRERVDVVLNDDVREFKEDNTIPKLKTQTYTRTDEDGVAHEVTDAGFTQVILQQTAGQQRQLEWIKQQLIAFEEMSGAQKKENKHIPLVMFGLAKKATLDLRLISATNPDEPGTKTNQAVSEIRRLYDESAAYRGTQLVFSDLYQSPEVKDSVLGTDQQGVEVDNPDFGVKRFNLFEDIRAKLIAQGIPESEIAIVPDDKDKREPVFEKVRSGEVRVLLGTSARMGVGVNVQTLLAGLHHLDAPQRPTDFEQRNGRILRQGNIHAQMGKPVEVLTYGVDKTLDATAYQRLAIKQKFINQVLKGQISDNEVSDISDDDDFASMSFDQMMATLSGSQYALLYTQKQVELSKVVQAEKNWQRGIMEAAEEVRRSKSNIESYKAKAARLVQNVGDLNKHFNEDNDVVSLEFDGKKYTSKEEWKEPFAEFIKEIIFDYAQGGRSQYALKVNDLLIVLEGTMEMNSQIGKSVVAVHYSWRVSNYEGGMDGTISVSHKLLTSLSSAIDNRRKDLELMDIEAYESRQNARIDEFTKKIDAPFKDREKLQKLESDLADLKQKMEQEVIDTSSASDAMDVVQGPVADASVAPQMQLSNPQTGQPQTASSPLVQTIQQAFPNVAVVDDPAAYEQALEDSGAAQLLGDVRPKGFAWNNQVYLSPDATENTVLHEYGHIWQQAAKQNQPELYAKGLELIRNSPYLSEIKANPYYSTLSEAEQLDEVMAKAIGDEGVKFVKPDQRLGFGQWLADLWNWIKQTLGFEQNPAQMTLNDFVGQVVGQLTGGQDLSYNTTTDLGANLPQFQLPAGVTPMSLPQMRQDAESRLTTIPMLAIGAGVNPDLFDTPVKEWSADDIAYVKTVKKLTGYELVAPQTLRYTRPGDLFHLADGTAVKMEGYQVNQVLTEGFVQAYENQSNRGKLFRTVVDKMRSWTNLETFMDLLDNAAGNLATLIKEVKRSTARRAAYAQVTLEPLRQDAEQKLADFSLRTGNSLETVKTMSVQTYDYDDTGAVINRDVEIPVAVGMELALLAETQIESYGEASHIVGQAPLPTQLYRDNPDGSRTRWKKGAVYYDADNDITHYLLMDKAELDYLRDRFEQGNGGYSGEAEAYQALKAFYNQREVVNLLEEENNFLNPDTPFDRVQYYYPIRTFNNEQDARTQSRGFSRTLDESRQLIARQSAADAVLVRDPITTMNDYEGSIVDILEHGRLVENLNALKNGIESDYTGPKKAQLIGFIEARRDDFQNHRKKRAQAYEQRGFAHWLESGMRRYTQSVFSLNVGLPLKQTGTYAAALGQGIIGDEYLRSSEAAGVVSLLTASAYRDWEAPSTVVNGTDQGFQGSLTGADTQERPYLEEIFGASMPDDASKAQQIKRFATVLDRLTHSQTLYTGDVEWQDLGLNSRTLTNGQKALRAFDEWNTEYGLAAMKRADRAVILGYYTAAKLQAADEGLAPDSNDYWDRVADLTERTLYATNQMSNLTEQTPMQLSTDFIAKILGLYSGQQQKLLNTVLQALNKYVKTGEGTPEATAALQQMAKTFGWAVVFNAAWVAAISAGAQALMAILSGDQPKDWEQMRTGIGWDFVRNMAGTVPGLGQQAIEYWISQMDDRPGTDALLQITAAENLQTGLDIIGGMATYLTSEDEAKRDKALDSVIYDVTDFTSKATGTPASVVRLSREWLTTDKDD